LKPTVRRNLPLLASTLFATFALIALGLSLSWRAEDQRHLNRVATDNCQAIEALKTQFRSQARTNYRALPRNARLLDIPLTPELRLEARRARDRTLARFAPRDC
jgi:hypothetical protein